MYGMYLKISARNEFFNPKERLKTLFFDPHRLAPHRGANLGYKRGIVSLGTSCKVWCKPGWPKNS
jgi:hypothetical protein